MSKSLFEARMAEDIKTRTYYGKFIFNSHFLVFLMIAAGVLLYTLLSLRESLNPSIYIDLISVFVIVVVLNPKYRSLLKEADILFLPPYEKHMSAYFKRANIYSLSLGITLPIVTSIAALILLSIGHDTLSLIFFFLAAFILYLNTFSLKAKAVNTGLNSFLVTVSILVINFVSLFLVLMHPGFIVLTIILIAVGQIFVKRASFSTISWMNYTQYEKDQQQSYYQTVSMFTNVKSIDKSFKRRKVLDFLLPVYKGEKFDKKYMYEYLFYRSFIRDHDLPMIVLRIMILFFIIMLWISNLYVSLIFSLFGIYIIVLQMSQVYTAQAYLLWPKVWPVKRTYIQDSYIRYSHKVVFIITIIFSVVFILIHPAQFYLGILFPVWGYVLNRIYSKSIYKKEEELSD